MPTTRRMAKEGPKRILGTKKNIPQKSKKPKNNENSVSVKKNVHCIEYLLTLCKPFELKIEREIWTHFEQKTRNQCISNGNSLNFDIFPNIIN